MGRRPAVNQDFRDSTSAPTLHSTRGKVVVETPQRIMIAHHCDIVAVVEIADGGLELIDGTVQVKRRGDLALSDWRRGLLPVCMNPKVVTNGIPVLGECGIGAKLIVIGPTLAHNASNSIDARGGITRPFDMRCAGNSAGMGKGGPDGQRDLP